jgi:hypothetical protein
MVLWHWGDAGTFTGYFAVDVAQKTGFVYLVNGYYGLAIVDRIMAMVLEGSHPALSFSVGDWSFSEDYLSPAMAFQCIYLNESPGQALDFYEQRARSSPQGYGIIREGRLAYWLSEFIAEGRAGDAVNILHLRLRAYHPERSQAFFSLAERYREDRSDERALRCLEAGAAALRDSQFTWAVEGIGSILMPVMLEESLLRSYAGAFGPVELAYEDGSLYFIRRDRGLKLKMTPMSDVLFRLEDVDYYRVQVLTEGGTVAGLKGLFSDGRTHILEKSP